MREEIEILHDIRKRIEEARIYSHVFPDRRDRISKEIEQLVRLAVECVKTMEEDQERWGRVARATLGGHVK